MSRPVAIRPVGQRHSYLHPLIYGPPGSGKTLLAGTSPGKCLILECGTGETDTNVAAGQKVDVWEIECRRDIEEAEEYLRHEGHREYDWGWCDGLSQLEGRLMKEIMEETGKKPNRLRELPDKPEYLKVQNIMDLLVTQFVKLPMHFGFTAHVMMETVPTIDAEGDEIQVTMLLPQIQGGRGKLSQKICGYMNVVGYLNSIPKEGDEESGTVRAMLVSDQYNILAKERFFGAIGTHRGYMLNPTIPKIMSAVQGQLDKGKNKPPAKKTAKKSSKTTKKAPAKKAAKSVSKATGLRTK